MTSERTTNPSLATPIRDILLELKEALQKRYEDFSHACTEIERTGDIVSSLSLKFDTLISLVPIKERDWCKRKISLILKIKRDGVAI